MLMMKYIQCEHNDELYGLLEFVKLKMIIMRGNVIPLQSHSKRTDKCKLYEHTLFTLAVEAGGFIILRIIFKHGNVMYVTIAED